MPAAIKKGLATIIWGTDNVMNIVNGAIIESGKITPKNGAPIEIEDNNGFAASMILLDDGFDAEITLLYDTAKTWPGIGDKVTLVLPTWGAAGGTTSFANCFVGATPNPDVARKREANISYKIVFRPAITS